nr:terminase family protein [Allobranchiibius sp. GilTou38]
MQQRFHDATEHDVLFGGAAGGGKSAALVADDLRDAVRYAGVRIAVFRRSYDELNESVIRQLASFGFGEALGASWNASDRELKFKNGSVIRYRYAETLVDASRRQGGEFQKLSLDERTLFAPGIVDMLQERLRSGSGMPVIGVRSTTNPGGPDHAAVRARYVDATDHGANVVRDGQGRSVRFIPAKVGDNPHVDAGYRRQLEAIPDPARRAAMLDGSWDQFSGQFFTEWDRDRHLVPTFEVPQSWARCAGIDWGYAAPWGCLWLAMDEDGRAYAYRERYGAKVGEVEQAQQVLAAEDEDEDVVRFADDAMWTSRGSAKSVAEVYAEQGCHIITAHKGERASGWARVHSYLGEAPACLYHREMGWETCPKLHVLDGRCPNLVRTLPAMCHDPRKPEDLDTRGDDHIIDCLRYALINVARPTIEGFLMPEPAAPLSEWSPSTPEEDYWALRAAWGTEGDPVYPPDTGWQHLFHQW